MSLGEKFIEKYGKKKGKKTSAAPTGIGQQVKLRGREAFGEVVAWYEPHEIELRSGKKIQWNLATCTVAWAWKAYQADPPIKGLVWGYITPRELELIE